MTANRLLLPHPLGVPRKGPKPRLARKPAPPAAKAAPAPARRISTRPPGRPARVERPLPRLTRSAGAILIQALPWGQRDIADRVGIDRTLVTRFGLGERVPTKPQRQLLFAEFGIPPEAWDRMPEAPPEPDPGGVPELTDATFRMQTQALFGEVQHLRNAADWYRRQNNPKMHMSTVKAAIAQHVLLGKLLGITLEITEEKAARLPAVRRILERVALALQPYPEAYEAAREALSGP